MLPTSPGVISALNGWLATGGGSGASMPALAGCRRLADLAVAGWLINVCVNSW